MSGSSLVEKLRIKPGQQVLVLNAPSGYLSRLSDLPEGVEVSQEAEGTCDFVQLFVKDSSEFHEHCSTMVDSVAYDGLL